MFVRLSVPSILHRLLLPMADFLRAIDSSTAPSIMAFSGKCEQCHVISSRWKLNTDLCLYVGSSTKLAGDNRRDALRRRAEDSPGRLGRAARDACRTTLHAKCRA